MHKSLYTYIYMSISGKLIHVFAGGLYYLNKIYLRQIGFAESTWNHFLNVCWKMLENF